MNHDVYIGGMSVTEKMDLELELPVNQWKLKFFRRYVRRYLKKGFHGVRMLKSASRTEKAVQLPDGPTLIIANHPSWWDPMIVFFLGELLGEKCRHYAPIDADMLERYGIFKNMGLGASQLVKTCPHVHVMPLAVEYTFWNEKTPELLLHMGEPQQFDGVLNENLENMLEECMDELAEAAISRNPEHFDVLIGGEAGVGGFYGWWQKLRGYQDEHESKAQQNGVQ